MNEDHFQYVQKLVYQHSSIVLDDGKQYLAEARLSPLARELGLPTVEELVGKLQKELYNGLHQRAVEALTTNETSFFRDAHVFKALQETIFKELIEARKNERTLRIWSAAASSGQEGYTLSMILRDRFPELATWKVDLLGTDLDTQILKRAEAASYSQLEVNRGLPATLLVKHFERDGMRWVVKPEIRQMVRFQQMNLAKAWPSLPQMDLILMRNVLIYFDMDTKKRILGKVHDHLRPNGYLILGGAETTVNIDPRYERVQVGSAVLYRAGS